MCITLHIFNNFHILYGSSHRKIQNFYLYLWGLWGYQSLSRNACGLSINCDIHRIKRIYLENQLFTGSPINEKIIDDHLAVQAIIRSYQVNHTLYQLYTLYKIMYMFCKHDAIRYCLHILFCHTHKPFANAPCYSLPPVTVLR